MGRKIKYKIFDIFLKNSKISKYDYWNLVKSVNMITEINLW